MCIVQSLNQEWILSELNYNFYLTWIIYICSLYSEYILRISLLICLTVYNQIGTGFSTSPWHKPTTLIWLMTPIKKFLISVQDEVISEHYKSF